MQTVLDYEQQSQSGSAPDAVTIATTTVPIKIVADSIFLRIRDEQPMTPAGYPLDRYWAALDIEFPANIGVLGLSPVGFSSTRREALAMITYACGIDCGFEAFFVLDRSGTEWKVRDYRLLSGVLPGRAPPQ